MKRVKYGLRLALKNEELIKGKDGKSVTYKIQDINESKFKLKTFKAKKIKTIFNRASRAKTISKSVAFQKPTIKQEFPTENLVPKFVHQEPTFDTCTTPQEFVLNKDVIPVPNKIEGLRQSSNPPQGSNPPQISNPPQSSNPSQSYKIQIDFEIPLSSAISQSSKIPQSSKLNNSSNLRQSCRIANTSQTTENKVKVFPFSEIEEVAKCVVSRYKNGEVRTNWGSFLN